MVEPEMAFYNLKDNMDLAEEFIKFILGEAAKDRGLAIFAH